MAQIRSASLWTAFFLLGSFEIASAGTLTTVDNTDATALADALTSGGAGGITITNAVLSANVSGTSASTGLFSTQGANNFGLGGSGIVISSGDAAQNGTTGAFINGVTTNFGTDATASQTALLNQVGSAPSGWHDVTELDITFSVDASTTNIFFNTVFTSAEYPNYVGSYIDGFGLFLNGVNVAYAGGAPVNIDNPGFVNTVYPTNGGNDGTAYQTTPEQGVLVEDGSAVLTYGGAVTPGSTDNTLTFIIADANDNVLDTTAFIQGLGNAPPPVTPVPEASTWAMMMLGFAGLGLAGYRKSRKNPAYAG